MYHHVWDEPGASEQASPDQQLKALVVCKATRATLVCVRVRLLWLQ